ncbi:hypothetical protein A9Z42_0088030 [Trichoderma parareesei]|uniref:C2H2-type domain-containing protein n=1 Tax=Trichoderma parareesei TaxID=858221 RepID=A0A2H2ZT39_TRIPA|nr:hypothetical protein A9Z42_0088030 [Trichoderma parareesei]
MHLSRHLEEISLSALPVEIASNAGSEDTSERDDMSSPSKFNHGGGDTDQGLPSGIKAMKNDARHDVQDAHDPDSLDSHNETRNHGTLSDILRLRSAAAQGDVETVARILQTKGSYGMPEALVTAAIYLRHEVFQLLLSFGANPDPSPVLVAEYPTPMLAAIGRIDTSILELLLEQKGFNPTRTFDGETYYEIARRRQGPNWEKEEHILRTAYNEYKRRRAGLGDEDSPDTGTEADNHHSKGSRVNEDLQRQDPGTNASFELEAPSPTGDLTSQGELEIQQTHQRPYTCSICHMSFNREADCDKHTKTLHIEKVKDYHDFLATVKSYFNDQPDKFTRFLNILTVLLRGPCQQCLSRKELSNLLPYQYRIEAIDHSKVQFYAPNTDPVIIEAVKRPEDSQGQQTSDNPAVDTSDVSKSHIDYVELEKVGSTESWVAKVKDHFTGSPLVYRQLLEILRDAQDDARSTQDAYLAAKKLFGANRDLIDEFQILTAKGELKLDESLLQKIRSVAQYGTGSPDQLHIDREERGQGSMEAVATAKWQCPECRERVDIAEVEEGNPGGSDERKQIPSFGRINYPQPNPDIYIWPPDSYGSVDVTPDEASSSYVPPPLPPPPVTKDDNPIDDEDDRPGEDYHA